MTKNEVVNIIAKEKVVEQIVSNIAKTNSDILNDLSQNIYIDLLMKDDEKIVNLYETNQLRFFIVKMAKNNLFSKNSPFYKTFKKNANLTVDIDDLKDKL